MKILTSMFIATLALAGTARAQAPQTHEHEHNQPPAATEEKAGADQKAMCACCTKDSGMMKDMMKEMMKDRGDGKEKAK